MESLRIIRFAAVAAIVYGIVHDQVTAHLCVEYFTIAHPPVFATRSPFLLALGWGVIATWWVGVSLGIGLAAAARLGPMPRQSLADLRQPIVRLMLVTAALACLAGLLGAFLVASGTVQLDDVWLTSIPPERQVAFAGVASAHGASYASGLLGGLWLIVRTVRQRLYLRRLKALPDEIPTPSARGAAVARELEERYAITLPEDFRDYLIARAPESDWMDRYGFTWWAPEQIKNLPDECGPRNPGAAVNPEIEAEAQQYLVFADFLIWCYAYAICCSSGPNRGKVALVGSDPNVFVARSFSRFVELVNADSVRLHPSAEHALTDLD
jgi:hypothetical protein